MLDSPQIGTKQGSRPTKWQQPQNCKTDFDEGPTRPWSFKLTIEYSPADSARQAPTIPPNPDSSALFFLKPRNWFCRLLALPSINQAQTPLWT
jgi:hypothetical protein